MGSIYSTNLGYRVRLPVPTLYGHAMSQRSHLQRDGMLHHMQAILSLRLSCSLLLQDVDEAHAGDIVMVAGLADIGIGDTIVDPANPNVSLVLWACFPMY